MGDDLTKKDKRSGERARKRPSGIKFAWLGARHSRHPHHKAGVKYPQPVSLEWIYYGFLRSGATEADRPLTIREKTCAKRSKGNSRGLNEPAITGISKSLDLDA